MSDDQDYYLARAEQELELAQQSEQPDAVRIHYLLAGYYLDRVYGEETVADAAGKSDGKVVA
jgi:hypothetical protein